MSNAVEDEKLLAAKLSMGGSIQREAISQIYRDFGSRIRSYYRSRGATPDHAEDWLQETFVKIVASSSTFRGDAPFAAWIWTIARNVMLDALRRGSGDVSLNEAPDLAENIPDTEPLQEALVLKGEANECVRTRFKKFALENPERAQCILWAVSDHLSMSDIASIIGRNIGATREYIAQCRKKLRVYLQPCLELQVA